MRFAYYTVEGSTLSWQRRLLDEGHEVLVFFGKGKDGNPIPQKGVGAGLVPVETSRERWIRWGSERADTIWFFDGSGAGKFAELLRRSGKLVVGGGEFCDRLENDRPFGEKFAAQAGVMIPPTKEFSSVSAAIAFLEKNPKQQFGDGGWAWKSNTYLEASATFVGKDSKEVIEYLKYVMSRFRDGISCILQEKIDGVALSTAQWWNGRAFVGPLEGTLEKKKFMCGEKGPATGCSLNLVWFYPDAPPIARTLRWDGVGQQLLKNNAPPGLYDINAIVNDDGAYFLEWTPRLGIDSEPTSQRGIVNLGQFLYNLATGRDVEQLFIKDRAYCAVRISVPPYPTESKGVEDLKTAEHVPIWGADGLWQGHFVAAGVAQGPNGLEVADPYGFVGNVLASGTNLKTMFDEVYSYLDKELRIPNLQYRKDAYEAISKDIEEMAEMGWETTPILEVE